MGFRLARSLFLSLIIIIRNHKENNYYFFRLEAILNQSMPVHDLFLIEYLRQSISYIVLQFIFSMISIETCGISFEFSNGVTNLPLLYDLQTVLLFLWFLSKDIFSFVPLALRCMKL